MACNLTHGRGIPCRDLVGGVKYIYFAKLSDIVAANTVITAGQLATLDMTTADFYRYSIRRGNASVTVKLTGLSTQDQNELKLMAQSQVVAFVQLNQILTNGHNVILVLGLTNGLDLNSGTNASGAAFADMNGYDWTFEGSEVDPMITCEDYTTTPLDNSTYTYGAIVIS